MRQMRLLVAPVQWERSTPVHAARHDVAHEKMKSRRELAAF
jgi:hypothetical protein